MNRFSAYLFAAIIALSTFGCKDKNTENPAPAPTKTELLTNRNWIVTAQTISPGISFGGTTITDLYALQSPCERDNFLRFETPNVFKEDEGATKCNSSDPQTTTGTWTFNADQTVLTVSYPNGGSSTSLNIVELTDASMKLTYSEALNGVNYTITTTFRKG